MKFTTLESFPKGQVCCLCLSEEADLYRFGQIHKMSSVIVHYFCLLLASKIKQNGKDNQGIWGFFLKDIKEEINRGKSLRCSYCTKNGATVHCCKKACRTIFHLSCGLAHGTKHLFFGEFKSFCGKHSDQQVIPIAIINNIGKIRGTCIICLSPILIIKNADVIWPICCKPTTLLHRLCIQKMAFNSGYYFKCPLCNNKSKFIRNMKQLGIYIPKQEAAWEQEPNAYQELLVNASKCEAELCDCPRGREFDKSGTKWHMLLCSFCGVNNIHLACAKLLPEHKNQNDWKCSICIKLSANSETSQIPEDTPGETVGNLNFTEEANVIIDAQKNSEGVHETNYSSRQGGTDDETLLKSSINEAIPLSIKVSEKKHENLTSLKQQDHITSKDDLVSDKHTDETTTANDLCASSSATSKLINDKSTTTSPISLAQGIKVNKNQKPKLLVTEIINVDSEDDEKNEKKTRVDPMDSLQVKKPRLLTYEIVNIDSEEEEVRLSSFKPSADTDTNQVVEKTVQPTEQILRKPSLLVSDVVIVESDDELENDENGQYKKRRLNVCSSSQPLQRQSFSSNTISQKDGKGEPITFFMMSKEGIKECLGKSFIKKWNANKIDSLFPDVINNDTLTLFLVSLCKLNENQSKCYIEGNNHKEFSIKTFLKDHSFSELFVFCEKRYLLYRIVIAQKQQMHLNENDRHLLAPLGNRNNSSLVKCNSYKNLVNLKQMIVFKAIEFHTNSHNDSPSSVQFKYLFKSSDMVNFCKFVHSVTVGNICYSICDREGWVYGEIFNNYLPNWVQGKVMCHTNFKLKTVLQETIISLEENCDIPFTILLAFADFSSVSRQSQNSYFFDEVQFILKKFPKANIILTTVLYPKDKFSFLYRQIKMFNQHLLNMVNMLDLYYWDIRNISF